MLGHLVNASGSVELAITTLALRDGSALPTLNLTDPDPQCDLDCIPLVGRSSALSDGAQIVRGLRRTSGRHCPAPLERCGNRLRLSAALGRVTFRSLVGNQIRPVLSR